jgi:hypothetical protein
MSWDYAIRSYAGHRHQKLKAGTLVMETTHHGEASRDTEIAVYRDRIARGEIMLIEISNLRDPFQPIEHIGHP